MSSSVIGGVRGALRQSQATLASSSRCASHHEANALARAAPLRAARLHIGSAQRNLVTATSKSVSETSFGILQMLEDKAAVAKEESHADSKDTVSGMVMSSVGGIVRIDLKGPVAACGAVHLPGGGLGFVLGFDKRGALVAQLTGPVPKSGEHATACDVLTLRDLDATFASVQELLMPSGRDASSAVAIPAMPVPGQRLPVKSRMASGIAVAEMLMPLAEGHRVAFVGPPTTGKTTAAAMLMRSQPADTAIVYAAHRPLNVVKRQLGADLAERQGMRVVYADPTASSAGARYMLPLCAMRIADNLRKTHRHVLLVLDDAACLPEAAADLRTPPFSAPQLLAAALDAAGNVRGSQGALSVVVVADLDHEAEDLHPTQRDLWRIIDSSTDVRLPFDLRLAADGVMPAVMAEGMLACGPAPAYQAPLLQRLRAELLSAVIKGKERSEQIDTFGQLGLDVEPQDEEDEASGRVSRALFLHRDARSLRELTVIMAASLVFHFPQYGRRPSPSSVAVFQRQVCAFVQQADPRLWETLDMAESLSNEEAQRTLKYLGQLLVSHRYEFDLTRPPAGL